MIETTKGQKFNYGLRLYRPLDADQTQEFIANLAKNPIESTGS